MLVEFQQVAIAGDDEFSLCGGCASEHVVIVGIAADGGWQGLRLGELSQTLVILHECAGGEPGGGHALGKLVACDDLSEFGQEDTAGAEGHGAGAARTP